MLGLGNFDNDTCYGLGNTSHVRKTSLSLCSFLLFPEAFVYNFPLYPPSIMRHLSRPDTFDNDEQFFQLRKQAQVEVMAC